MRVWDARLIVIDVGSAVVPARTPIAALGIPCVTARAGSQAVLGTLAVDAFIELVAASGVAAPFVCAGRGDAAAAATTAAGGTGDIGVGTTTATNGAAAVGAVGVAVGVAIAVCWKTGMTLTLVVPCTITIVPKTVFADKDSVFGTPIVIAHTVSMCFTTARTGACPGMVGDTSCMAVVVGSVTSIAENLVLVGGIDPSAFVTAVWAGTFDLRCNFPVTCATTPYLGFWGCCPGTVQGTLIVFWNDFYIASCIPIIGSYRCGRWTRDI